MAFYSKKPMALIDGDKASYRRTTGSEQLGMTAEQIKLTEGKAYELKDAMREKGISETDFEYIKKATGSQAAAERAVMNAPANVLRQMIAAQKKKENPASNPPQTQGSSNQTQNNTASGSSQATTGSSASLLNMKMKEKGISFDDYKLIIIATGSKEAAERAIINAPANILREMIKKADSEYTSQGSTGSAEDEITDFMENVNIPEEWKENVIEEMVASGYNINDGISISGFKNDISNETLNALPGMEGIIDVKYFSDTQQYNVGSLSLLDKWAKSVVMHETITINYAKLYYNKVSKPKIMLRSVDFKAAADWDRTQSGSIYVSYMTVDSITVNGNTFVDIKRQQNMTGKTPYATASLNLYRYILEPEEALNIVVSYRAKAAIDEDTSPGLITVIATSSSEGGGTVVYNKTF